MGFAPALFASVVLQSSLPVFASNARNRRSLVVPTNTTPPAVTDGPALPALPTSCLPSGNASFKPSTLSQAISPVTALTATSLPHGGRWHGALGPTARPLASNCPLIGALKVKNGPTPLMLARSYGCFEP